VIGSVYVDEVVTFFDWTTPVMYLCGSSFSMKSIESPTPIPSQVRSVGGPLSPRGEEAWSRDPLVIVLES
jgi:hypothetical protein